MAANSAAELISQQEEPVMHEKVVKEVRVAKRAVTVAVMVSVVAVAGVACALIFRGGASGASAAPPTRLVQLNDAKVKGVQDHLTSIEASSVDAQAKLQAGAAAIAAHFFDGPDDVISEGEATAVVAPAQDLGSEAMPELKKETDDETMQTQMEALKAAQDRVKLVANQFISKHPRQPRRYQDPDEEPDCSQHVEDLVAEGALPVHGDCSPNGWYRVYIDTIMRKEASMQSPQVRILPLGTLVHVVEMKGRRMRVDLVGNQPEDAVKLSGWISRRTDDNVVIIRPSKSAIYFDRLRRNDTSIASKVFQNAKLLSARKEFKKQFESTARATAMEHDLKQKLKAIDPDRLAIGLSNMERNKKKTGDAIAQKVLATGKGFGARLQEDANKVVDKLDAAPDAQKLVRGLPEFVEKEVEKEVSDKVPPQKLLSQAGQSFVNSLSEELKR